MPEQIPDWVTETPAAEAIEFHVLRCGTAEHGMQFVKMTRDEFIALKRHLAAMRGYNAPTVTKALARIRREGVKSKGSVGYNTRDDQQIAAHLQTARDFYRAFPQFVALQSEAFDAELESAACGVKGD